LSPRLQRYAANLDLLHKTKEETRLDRLQQQAQAASTDDIEFINFDDDVDNHMDANIHQPTDALPNITAIDDAITYSIDIPDDFYSQEGIDASHEWGYFSSSSPPDSAMRLDHGVYFSSIPSTDLAKAMDSLTQALSPTASAPFMTSSSVGVVVQPTVYLSNETQVERAIAHVIADFSLNEQQSQAFQIVAHHTLDTAEDPKKQLLMGLFSEAGTGKSRLVDAIKTWFSLLNRSAELIITATMGAAAFNIWGSTIHSALGITIKWGDKTRKMGVEKMKEWRDRWYLIIDEVS